MRAFAPSRIGPSSSSTDVNDDAQVGHRSTSVKTDHTTSIGASMVTDARSTPGFSMSCPFPASNSGLMYQMVHAADEGVKGDHGVRLCDTMSRLPYKEIRIIE